MICAQCKHRNGIGSKFCRECGATLPLPESPLALEEAARAERDRLTERVAGLLSAAYTLAEQKRYDQALPLAEEAVLLLPDSTAALSLLATLYEYSGQDEKAIRTMERVVALNPESPGDRQKLGQLRQAFQQAQSDEPFPIRGAAAAGRAAASSGGLATARGASGLTVNRPSYLPYILGAAAAACVLGLGLSYANAHNHSATGRETMRGGALTTRGSLVGTDPTGAELAARSLAGSGNASVATAPAQAAPPPSIPTYAAGADPFARQNGNGGSTSANYAESLAGAGRVPAPPRYRTYGGGASLPNLGAPAPPSNGGNSGGGYDSSPAQPLPPIIAVAPNAGNGGNTGGVSPYGATESGTQPVRIAAGPPPGFNGNGGTNVAPAIPAAQPHGTIIISVGKTPTANSANSGSTSAGSASSTPSSTGGGGMSRGRNLQATGHYADAIAAYREALSSDSGSAGAAWQGIAQCDESLHDEGGARGAYVSALHAYEAQQSAGHNPSAARRGIDTCKAALDALGG